MRCIQFGVLAFCLLAASQGYAQTPWGEVAGSFRAGRDIVGRDCPAAFSPCSAWGWGWSGAFAIYATDRVSLAGAFSGLHQSLDANVGIRGSSFPLSATADTLTLAGGVRVHTDRVARMRLFGHVLLGYSRTNAAVVEFGGIDLTAFGDEDLDFSTSGLTVIPGAGLDITVADRVAVRLEADLQSVLTRGSSIAFVNVAAGLVFAVGN